MDYTILKVGGKVNNPLYHEITAMTRAAVSTLPTDPEEIAWGSQCLVLEDSSVWILATTQIWVEI